MVQLIKRFVGSFHMVGYQSLDDEQLALMRKAARAATETLKTSGRYEAEVEAREEIRQRVLAA